MIIKYVSILAALFTLWWGPPLQEPPIILIDATPAPKSTVAPPVEQIELRFSEPVATANITVQQAGEPDDTRIEGDTVILVYTEGLPEATHIVQWAVEGTSGARAEASYTFTVAQSPPTLRFMFPQDGATLLSGPTRLTFVLEGSVTNIQYTVNGETKTASENPIDTDLPPGIYDIEAVVVDDGTPLESTRERITINVVEDVPQTSGTQQVPIEPTSAAEAIASVIAVVVLITLGILLGSRTKDQTSL